jgi:hypothetical protein
VLGIGAGPVHVAPGAGVGFAENAAPFTRAWQANVAGWKNAPVLQLESEYSATLTAEVQKAAVGCPQLQDGQVG